MLNSDATAETYAKKFVNQFIFTFNYLFILTKEKSRSLARHPSGNEMIERFNQTLIQMIINGKQNL